jgi:quinol monooxygenase YgiN
MLTITAIIRTKPGHEDTMRNGLLEVAENVRLNEPQTISFFVSQSIETPQVFTTYERFANEAAMNAHNNSEVVANSSRSPSRFLMETSCWSRQWRRPRRPESRAIPPETCPTRFKTSHHPHGSHAHAFAGRQVAF